MPAPLTKDAKYEGTEAQILSQTLQDFCDCLSRHWQAQLHIL